MISNANGKFMSAWSCVHDIWRASGAGHATLGIIREGPRLQGLDVGGERRAFVEETGNKDTSRRKPAVIVAVVVLAEAVICGGELWWHNHSVREHDQALASYRAAVRDYTGREREYRSYVDSDEVRSASAVS